MPLKSLEGGRMQLRNPVLVDAARSPFARGLAAQRIGAGMGISTVFESAD
jgi:hypothetical protein